MMCQSAFFPLTQRDLDLKFISHSLADCSVKINGFLWREEAAMFILRNTAVLTDKLGLINEPAARKEGQI